MESNQENNPKQDKKPNKKKAKTRAKERPPARPAPGSEEETVTMMIESTIREYSMLTNPDLVIRIANNITGLTVDEKGYVRSGASLENYIAFVEKVREAMGPVALLLAKKSIVGIADKKMMKRLPGDLR